MKAKVTLGSRILLGLIFFVFGLNGFLNFIPQPPMTGAPLDFIMALINTHYLFPLIKGLEVVAGIALLSGFFVPLAQLVLSPIIVNIFLFHTILAPEGAPIAILVVALQVALAWGNWDRFKGVVAAK